MKLSLNFSIFILHQLFHVFSDKEFLETLAILIFGPLIPSNIISLMKQPAKLPSSYSSQWIFRNFWDEYIKSENENAGIKKSDSFEDSEDEKKIKSDPVSLFLSKTKNNKTIQLNDLKSIYKNDPFKYENEHKRLSKALGILTKENIENANEILNKTPLIFIKQIRDYITNLNSLLHDRSEFSKNNGLELNELRDMFISLFTVLK